MAVLELKNEIKLLAGHSAIYTLGNFMQKITALLLLPVYTRFLSPHDYGIKELVALSADVIGILISVSIAASFFRFYFDCDSEDEKKELISTSLIAISIVGLCIVGLLSIFTQTIATVIVDDPSLYYYFLLAFATLWFQSINRIGFSYIRIKKESFKFIFLSFFRMIFAIGMNVYFICILQIGVVGILISSLLASILMFFIITIPLFLRVGIRFSKKKSKEMIRFGLPMIPEQLGGFIVHLSDRFFIKEYVSIADAGLYSLGYRFGALPANFISSPFNQIFQPRRLEVYKEEGAELIFGRIFTYFLIIMCFAGLLVSVLVKDILMIMSDEQFWPAYRIVPLVVLATTIFTFHYHLNMGILVTKKTKYFAYIGLSSAVIVLLLNILLIPRFGIFGAVWATLLSFIYKNVLTYYFSSKYFKICFELSRIFKLVIISALIYFCLQLIVINSIYFSFLTKMFLIMMLYPICLFIFQFFSNEEKGKLLNIIKTRRFFRSI